MRHARFHLAAVLLAASLVGGPADAGSLKSSSISTSDESLSILVLGDSYSAGNGAGEYRDRTCFRSSRNYGARFSQLVRAYAPGRTVTVDTRACSGATTLDYFAAQHRSVPAQSQWVNTSYDLIMLTLGGNDLRFRAITKQCLVGASDNSSKCDKALRYAENRIADGTVARDLTRVLGDLTRQAAPEVRIVLIGYPRLEGSSDLMLDSVQVGARLATIQARGESLARDAVRRLNAASTSGRTPYTFVSTRALFAGQLSWLRPDERTRHELFKRRANPDRWMVNPVRDASPREYLTYYHPNPMGWQRIADLLFHTPSVPKVGPSDPLGISGADWLYQALLDASAVGDAGTRRDVNLPGLSSANSTSLWVGCSGTPASATFRLAGRYSTLNTTLLLDPSVTPSALQARFRATVDGTVVGSWNLSSGVTTPISVNVAGAETLVVDAIALNPGQCGSSPIGYGIAYEAHLLPR